MKPLLAKLVVVPALLLIGVSGSAFAVHETEFSRLDVNEDGVISREEARGRLADEYVQADHDQDGVVNRSEFSAFEVQADDFSSPVTGPGGIGITEEFEPGRLD